jgi:hypothetical protein
VREHLRAGGRDDGGISRGVVVVLVRVQDLRDGEAVRARGVEALPRVERIDDERLAGFRACDQVLEIAQLVRRPDAFDQHARETKPSAPRRTARAAA